MLKLKDNVDLKELEKFGFEEYKEHDGYVYDIIPYIKDKQYSYIEIFNETRRISCLEYVEDEYVQIAIEKLFDLIKAGLVEKVNGE